MTTVKEIPAKLVAELRAKTGAGMMDCKRALEEAGGDMAKAQELLRVKLAGRAEKRADRAAGHRVTLQEHPSPPPGFTARGRRFYEEVKGI